MWRVHFGFCAPFKNIFFQSGLKPMNWNLLVSEMHIKCLIIHVAKIIILNLNYDLKKCAHTASFSYLVQYLKYAAEKVTSDIIYT